MISITIQDNGTALADNGIVYKIAGFRKSLFTELFFVDIDGHTHLLFAGERYDAILMNNMAELQI